MRTPLRPFVRFSVAQASAAAWLCACLPALGAPQGGGHDALIESVIRDSVMPPRTAAGRKISAAQAGPGPRADEPRPVVSEVDANARSGPPPSARDPRDSGAPTRDGLGAGSPSFPEGIDYSIQASRMVQQVGNPYRLPDTAGDQRRSDTAISDEVRAAFIVPLASERTRLLASAALGNVAYQHQGKLDYQPYALRTVLQWRAGDLLQGSASVSDRVRPYRFQASSWPERDLLTQRDVHADIGLRVTESLTLPVLSVARSASRNEYAPNQQLYNRDDTQFQISGRYEGIDKSSISAGMTLIRSSYPDRTPLQIQQLDRAYVDREYFVNGAWSYSPKTAVEGYLGWRQRRYANLASRDVDFLTADLRGYWHYSAKTSFHVHLRHSPWGNEEDPSTLYSTLTGGRVAVRWEASEKTWLSLNAVRERQKNTRIGTNSASSSDTWRVGARLEWQVLRNVMLTLDGWRERVNGHGQASYSGTVIRAGVMLNYDNQGPAPARLFMHEECDVPRYLDTRLCD